MIDTASPISIRREQSLPMYSTAVDNWQRPSNNIQREHGNALSSFSSFVASNEGTRITWYYVSSESEGRSFILHPRATHSHLALISNHTFRLDHREETWISHNLEQELAPYY